MKTTVRIIKNPLNLSRWHSSIVSLLWLAALNAQLSTSLHAQGGSLTPPGTPAPTMKTLDQLEPRTPISSLPFTISQSGSYYLTGNLQFTAASGSAITITVSNVTLDLNGFTLSSTAAVTGSAVLCSSTRSRICVKNGQIIGNTTVTITGSAPNQTWTTAAAGFGSGVDLSSTTQCQITHVNVSGCRDTGISVGSHSVIESTTASSNGSLGISAASSSVSHCTISSNGNIGIYAPSACVTHCSASFNAAGGVHADSGIVTHCMADSNGSSGIHANSGSVSSSSATLSGTNGIFSGSGSVTNSTASLNGGYGIQASNGVVAFCCAQGNGAGQITGGTLTGNKP